MDSISQGVLGAGIAEITVGKKLGNKSILVGAVLGTIPDLDVFITRGMDVVDGLLAHRGFSHSLLFGILLSPLLALLLQKIFRRYEISLHKWILTVWLVLFTHVLLDLFTTYGTGVFEPFSHARIEWSTIAIVDVFYTIPFVILVILLMFFKRASKSRFYLKWAAISLSTVYLLLTPLNKFRVNRVFTGQLAASGIEYERYKTVPLVLTNFLWMCVAESDSAYYTGYYSVFDKEKDITFLKTDRNDDLIDTKDAKIKKLIRFSKGWYIVHELNNTIVYSDLRFGRMGLDKESPYIFSFRIKQRKNNTIIEEHHEVSAAEGAFNSYIKRIFGNSN